MTRANHPFASLGSSMRLSRVTAVCCLAVATLLSGSVATSADAAQKPFRTFAYTHIVRTGDKGLSFQARVEHYPTSTIDLMKKTCKTCTWTQVTTATTSSNGKVALPIQAPVQGRWYWRYRTPASGAYAATYSATWYTFTH
jgi:hypothetical protein